MTKAQLNAIRDDVMRLGPWHLDVEVVPGLSTRVSLEAPVGTYPDTFGKVSFLDARETFLSLLRRLYPDGLQGRRVLDCACNCGGYVLWAKEYGAGQCVGFDVREHWISQARFLASHRLHGPSDVRFEVCDLYDLNGLELGTFDIVLFKGILYHLPDPIAGLQIAADHSSELILVNTATRNGLPDGMLVVSDEGNQELMSGVYGLNWFPTGPGVLERVLQWMGFPAVRCHWWRTHGGQREDLGRIEMLASRSPEILATFDDARAARAPSIQPADSDASEARARGRS